MQKTKLFIKNDNETYEEFEKRVNELADNLNASRISSIISDKNEPFFIHYLYEEEIVKKETIPIGFNK